MGLQEGCPAGAIVLEAETRRVGKTQPDLSLLLPLYLLLVSSVAQPNSAGRQGSQDKAVCCGRLPGDAEQSRKHFCKDKWRRIST